jgi:hypothetical protein
MSYSELLKRHDDTLLVYVVDGEHTSLALVHPRNGGKVFTGVSVKYSRIY